MNNKNSIPTVKFKHKINDLLTKDNLSNKVSQNLYREGLKLQSIKSDKSMSKLGIGVQNVNGISNDLKRRAIMLNLAQSDFNIICLISTKIRQSTEPKIIEENNRSHDFVFNSKGENNDNGC